MIFMQIGSPNTQHQSVEHKSMKKFRHQYGTSNTMFAMYVPQQPRWWKVEQQWLKGSAHTGLVHAHNSHCHNNFIQHHKSVCTGHRMLPDNLCQSNRNSSSTRDLQAFEILVTISTFDFPHSHDGREPQLQLLQLVHPVACRNTTKNLFPHEKATFVY